jgi:hypothetical protein
MIRNLKEQAVYFRRRLPSWLWDTLREEGIPDALVHARLIGWDGEQVTIPIFSRDRRVVSFEVAEVQNDGRLEVGVEQTPLIPFFYGAHLLRFGPQEVVLTEGVIESLVLSGQGFNALSSTGDGLSLSDAWALSLLKIPDCFICLKRREESIRVALSLCELIPHARIVTLPAEVGDGGGLYEFFMKLRGSAADFRALLDRAAGKSHG